MKKFTKYIPFVLIIILMGVAYMLDLQRFLSFDTLKATRMELLHWKTQHPILAPIAFMLLYAVATALSFPGGLILSIFGGFLFGMPWAAVYVVFGATTGASIIFGATKTAFGDLLRKKTQSLLAKMRAGFEKNAWSYMLFLRLVPLFPFWAINIAPAFLGVRFKTYLWTTFVGIIPGVYVYTQAGAGLGAIFDSGESFTLSTIFNTQVRIALILLAILALVPIVIKKLRRH